MKVSLDRIHKMVSTFRKSGNKVEEIARVIPTSKPSEMETNVAKQLATMVEEPIKVEVPKVETPKVYAVVNTLSAVDKILANAEKASLEREEIMAEYGKLPASTKALLKNRKLTKSQIAYAVRWDVIHTRAQKYGDRVSIGDYDNLDKLEIKLDTMDKQEALRIKSNQEVEASINRLVNRNTPYTSNNAPVFIVKQDYYVLLDGEQVFVQKSDDKVPLAVAKLGINDTRGSEIVFGSVNNPGLVPADSSDYKAILTDRPTWSEVCRAYKLCNGATVRFDFSKSEKLFG